MTDLHPKIVVVGSGIVGCSITWAFAQRGVKVTLLEENGRPFQGSSLSGFGSLTPYSDPFFDGEARDHAARGVEIYRQGWLHAIEQASGLEVALSEDGLIELCEDAADLERARKHAENLREHAAITNDAIPRAILLTPEEIREKEPALSGQYVGGLWLDEPWLDKDVFFEAFAIALERNNNITLRFNTSVKQIEDKNTGVTVITETGERINADWVVLCTGLRPSAIEDAPSFSLTWIRGDAIAVYTQDQKPLLQRHIYMKQGFITPRRDGRMLLGATYEPEIGIPLPNARLHRDRIEFSQIRRILESNEKILPALNKCDVGEVWRGWRPTPADNLPILGQIKTHPHIIMATGFIGLGITMAPATATSVAEFCLNGYDSFPSVFDPNRSFSS